MLRLFNRWKYVREAKARIVLKKVNGEKKLDIYHILLKEYHATF